MKQRISIVLVGLTGLLLTACGSMIQSMQMDSKIKEIELGMTRKEVIARLGNDYEAVGAGVTPHGTFEKISYYTYSMTDGSEGYYILTFREGRLVEWYKDKKRVSNHTHITTNK